MRQVQFCDEDMKPSARIGLLDNGKPAPITDRLWYADPVIDAIPAPQSSNTSLTGQIRPVRLAQGAYVAREREMWFQLLRELRLHTTASSGNFVFLETGLPHVDFATSLLKEGVDIGRAFPPYDRWARISIGLPAENAVPRAAVRKVLAARD